jgi:hypothetical protein
VTESLKKSFSAMKIEESREELNMMTDEFSFGAQEESRQSSESSNFTFRQPSREQSVTMSMIMMQERSNQEQEHSQTLTVDMRRV